LGIYRLSFHGFPDVKTDKGKLWIAKICRDASCDFVVNKNAKVCLLHFTAENYICGDALNLKGVFLKQLLFLSFSPGQLKSICVLLINLN